MPMKSFTRVKRSKDLNHRMKSVFEDAVEDHRINTRTLDKLHTLQIVGISAEVKVREL